MIKVILWDVDGTLLDFLAAEKRAIREGFASHGFGTCSDEMIEEYSAINRKYWEKMERGEITKSQVLLERFVEFFGNHGLPVEKVEHFNDEYQVNLGNTVVFHDDGYEVVKALKEKGFRQYAATNGTFIAQDAKLTKSGLYDLFDGVFISEKIGVEKPNREFFDKALKEIGVLDRSSVVIVGDSLSSDIQGGNNAGIICCWYNPEHKENNTHLKIDVEIDDLRKLEAELKYGRAASEYEGQK